MKILILSDDFPPNVSGGAGMMAFRISKGFVDQGHQVTVISTTQDKNNAGVTVLDNMKIYTLYSNYHDRWRSYVSLFNIKILGEIKSIMKEFSPNVVHAHNVHAHISYYALLVAKKYAKKVVMTTHDIMSFYPGTFTEFINPKDLKCPDVFNYRVNPVMLIKAFRLRYNPVRNIAVKYILSKIDKIVVVSNALKDAFAQNEITNSEVIYNGLKVDDWVVSEQAVSDFKKEFKIEDLDIMLFQGRLSGAKGGELILRALSLMVKNNKSARLLVVGKKDGYGDKMIDRARELGVEDNIIFTGWLKEDEIKKAYSASSVVVIPSVCFDSFPNGNLEGFFSHKPVVATCFGGSREIVQNGINGYIVNPFDVETLSERVNSLMIDKTKAKEFGEAGYELVKKEFNLNKVVEKYLTLFIK